MPKVYRSIVLVAFLTVLQVAGIVGQSKTGQALGIAAGRQYNAVHVYVAPADIDAFVNSIAATFDGKPSKRQTGNVLPVPSRAELQYIMSPVGMFSTFAYHTGVAYPFGEERAGYIW